MSGAVESTGLSSRLSQFREPSYELRFYPWVELEGPSHGLPPSFPCRESVDFRGGDPPILGMLGRVKSDRRCSWTSDKVITLAHAGPGLHGMPVRMSPKEAHHIPPEARLLL